MIEHAIQRSDHSVSERDHAAAPEEYLFEIGSRADHQIAVVAYGSAGTRKFLRQKSEPGHPAVGPSPGQEITITRHGEEVARLVPPRPARNRAQVHAALKHMRERAEHAKFGRFDWDEWKTYRDEGRP